MTTKKTTTPTRSRAKPATKPVRKPAAKPARSGRTLSIVSIGALVVAAGAGVFELIRRRSAPGNAEHEAPDLALDQPRPDANHRAPEAFRPDPSAPVPASEREGLRPASGPAPTLVAGA